MKRFDRDHCLWLCRMARTTGIFPCWTGYFPRKKSGEFEGKIQLAHARRRRPEEAAGGAQLDVEFAFYASRRLPRMGRWTRRGVLPWHGVCLSIFHSLVS